MCSCSGIEAEQLCIGVLHAPDFGKLVYVCWINVSNFSGFVQIIHLMLVIFRQQHSHFASSFASQFDYCHLFQKLLFKRCNLFLNLVEWCLYDEYMFSCSEKCLGCSANISKQSRMTLTFVNDLKHGGTFSVMSSLDGNISLNTDVFVYNNWIYVMTITDTVPTPTWNLVCQNASLSTSSLRHIMRCVNCDTVKPV